jgi:hypothetical protein
MVSLTKEQMSDSDSGSGSGSDSRAQSEHGGFANSNSAQLKGIKLEDIKSFNEGFRSKFAPYRDIINNLTISQNIETEEDIIYCSVSNDSSTILLVLQEDDENYCVKQYDTDTLKVKFTKQLSGEYIKAKEII